MGEPKKRFLIWSRYHCAWFRPKAAGYTVHIAAAGVFEPGYQIDRTRERKVTLTVKLREKIAQRQAELLDELTKLNQIERALSGKGPTP